ncbi:MAG TPA: M6 family metalloprotease domain-containing protein [Armatimonadota bacterium]|jgi:immune inhibitor A
MFSSSKAAFSLAAALISIAAVAAPPNGNEQVPATPAFSKSIDRPSIRDFERARERRAVIEAQDSLARTGTPPAESSARLAARGRMLAKTGTDKVLVILVEFDPAHPDTYTWTPGVSTWDPLGRANGAEWTGNVADVGNAAASNRLAQVNNITGPTNYTYSGPLHNQIPAPNQYSTYIWTPDFNPQWYNDLIFGNGVKFQYTRPDGSAMNEDFTGLSVRNYYEDLSGGQYNITGTVVGWLKLPHSVYWYGADPCPGARSGIRTSWAGAIPGAGNAQSLVTDALDAVNQAYPGFDWKSYDQNGDGVIDRLWIIHAGVGEEDSTALLNATPYGEGGMWSHSSAVYPQYTVYSDATSKVVAGPYIMMPENCGISVLAHEYAHNLGAEDLYAYDRGNPSAGFWTVMCNSWTGYPLGFLPTGMDPWHLDNWGWLDPVVASDPNRVYKVQLGQASGFPGGAGVSRGVRIPLPDGRSPLPVTPEAQYEWWGGAQDLANGMMTLNAPVAVPAAGATLTARMAWDIEQSWDFLWVQVSLDGSTWTTLINPYTSSVHDPNWIGGAYGFPDDLAAAGIGGFTGRSGGWPAYTDQTFDLSAFAGKSIRLRFWYMTDWSTTGAGPFVDSVQISSGLTTLLNSQPDPSSATWAYSAPWEVNDGGQRFSHNFYLQWRNATLSGGYDRSLAEPRWDMSPVNSGLLVWYNDNFYSDNEVGHHLTDPPGFGPKGRELVVDAHPQPYRWSAYAPLYPNEAADLSSYGMMRDAPFSLNDSVPFTYGGEAFSGRPAVPDFRDAQGYYPGAEFVSLGAGYTPPRMAWCTSQWDASAVMPGKVAYGLKAPGYAPTDPLYWGLYARGAGTVGATIQSGLGYAGGTGNPGDSGAAYGWNARVLTDAPAGGTVVVWNTAVPPVTASDDRYARAVSSPLTVSAPGVLANDSGPQGWPDVASAELVYQALNGTVVLSPSGAFTYTPNAGYNGADVFTYHIRTAYGAVSNEATVFIGRRGDVNLDGTVNLADARQALQIAGGLMAPLAPDRVMVVGDLSGDGRLDVLDAVRVLRIALGKDQ